MRIPVRGATEADLASLQALVAAAYEKYIPLIGRRPKPMLADYGAALAQHQLWVHQCEGRLAAVIELIDKKSKQLLGHPVTPIEIVSILTVAPPETGADKLPRPQDPSSDFATQTAIQQFTLGPVPSGVTGALVVGVGAAIGGAISDALLPADFGMRGVVLLDPPLADEQARRRLKAVTQNATSAPPHP